MGLFQSSRLGSNPGTHIMKILVLLMLLFAAPAIKAQEVRSPGMAPVKLAIPKSKPNVAALTMTNKKREVKFLFPRDWPNPQMFVVLSTKREEVALTKPVDGEYVYGFLLRPVKNGDIAIIEVRAILENPRKIQKADDMLNLRFEPAGLYALTRGESVVLNNLKRYGVKPITLFMLDRPPIEIK